VGDCCTDDLYSFLSDVFVLVSLSVSLGQNWSWSTHESRSKYSYLSLKEQAGVVIYKLKSNTLMEEQPQGDSEIIMYRGTLIPFILCRRLWGLWWSCHHLMLVGLMNLNFSHSILASYITNSDLSCPVHLLCFIYWIGHEHSLCMCLTICSSICCYVMAGSDVLVFRVYEYAFGRLQICGQRSVDLAIMSG
jgi:hypothetical protein